MFSTVNKRLFVILAAVVVSLFYLHSSGVKKGLDLQGGMHLLLQVKDPQGTMTASAKSDAIDRALKIVRTRIDEFGTQEPIIQKIGSGGTSRMIVELPGIKDEAEAQQIVTRAAHLTFNEVDKDGTFDHALPKLDRAVAAAISAGQLKASSGKKSSARDASQLLFKGDSSSKDSTKKGADSVSVDKPLSSLLTAVAPATYGVSAANVPVVEAYLANPDVRALFPRGVDIAWLKVDEDTPTGLPATPQDGRLIILKTPQLMDGDLLLDAKPSTDTRNGKTIVQFKLNTQGGRKFFQWTSTHVGDVLAIVLDGKVFSAPEILGAIGADGQIELGNSPMQAAANLALVLRSGALPAPLEIVEQRSVGPSLGADSVFRGEAAGILGVLLVILLMTVVYGFAGWLAVAGIGVYVIILLGGLSVFNATLTMPGIAGFILSIGMAVDSNILVYERIREEQDAGRSPRVAVDEGFKHAMAAVIDTHLTTLLTAVVLYQFGSGPIRGFAVTLIAGLVGSFFTAIFAVRTFFMMVLARRDAKAPLKI